MSFNFVFVPSVIQCTVGCIACTIVAMGQHGIFVTHDEDFNKIRQRLQRLQTLYAPHLTNDLLVLGGFETHDAASKYYWDGLKRGKDPDYPCVIFQYTLAGWGCYESGGQTSSVFPGMAFMAYVPSDHRYYFNPEAESWTFFWILTHHPYIVERINRATTAPVNAIPPSHTLVARALHLLEGVYIKGVFHDRFAEELALFEFMTEYERFLHQARYVPSERDTLLDHVRAYVLGALHRPLGVTELAARQGMTRSHFSHYFRATTGMTPAQYIMRIRIEEAAQRLMHTRLKLDSVAQETGFTDANHLCKVFRRHFHLSPGEFRRQMRQHRGSFHENG